MCSYFFRLLKLPPSHSHWSCGGGNIVIYQTTTRSQVSPEEFEEGNDKAERSK